MGVDRIQYLFVVFLFGVYALIPCHAQSIELGNSQSLKATAFDHETKTIYAIWKDSIRSFLAPDYRQSHLIEYRSPEVEFPDSYQAIVFDKSLHFVHNKGGVVYRVNNDTLERIDHSFNHKMQNNSTLFTRNDTIFRYGGYGFWSARNFFTYFSPGSKEWEIIVPDETTKDVPKGTLLSQVVQQENQAFVFSGIFLDPVKPIINRPYKEAWLFDFDTHIWKKLGPVEKDFHNYIRLAHMGDRILYMMPSSNYQVLADPIRNQLTYYPRQPRFKNVVGFLPHVYKYGSFYSDGIFFLLRSNSEDVDRASSKDLYYEVVAESDFLGEAFRKEALYSNAAFPWKSLGMLLGLTLLLGLVLFGYRKYSKWNKIVEGANNSKYRGKQIDLDPGSLAILNLLVRSEGEVSSQKVLDIVEKPTLSEVHNIKIKNQLIDALNLRFRTLLDIDKDLIEASRSEEDKRIRVYRIDPSYFKIK